MVVRYFEVDPLVTGLGYGFGAFMQGMREKDQEEHDKAIAQRHKRQRNTAIGVGAGLGAVGGLALAGPLGLAGTAAQPAAMAMGASVPATAATEGALGFGGVGGLGAGLAGAAIGAQAGNAFATDDWAGGISAIANPVVNALAQQENRRQQRSDRAEDRTARMQDAISLIQARSDEDLRQQVEASTIPTYGMPRSEATAASRAAYESAVSGGPQAGGVLELPATGESVPSYGPLGGPTPPEQGGPPPDLNVPGPSNIKGMEKIWGPSQYTALAKLEQERQATVDNPDWIAANGPIAREAQWQALARKRENIGTILVPSKPQPMFTNARGQSVPMQLGENVGQDGGKYLWDGQDIKHVAPTKQSEADREYTATMPDGTVRKQKAGSTIALEDGVWQVVDANGNVDIKDLRPKGGEGDGMKEYVKEAAQRYKPVGVGETAPNPVEQHNVEKAGAYELRIADLNPETITTEEYLALGAELLDAYGNKAAIPEKLRDKYNKLGVMLRKQQNQSAFR